MREVRRAELGAAMDQPAETNGPGPQVLSESERHLAALGAHLRAFRYDVELRGAGLRVVNPNAASCCSRVRADLIFCGPRLTDGGRWWFFTSWKQPLAEVGQTSVAVTGIKGYLGAP